MAFNAGSIEATLTLDRNPFTAGLKAARAEANRWARNDIKVAVNPQLSQTGLDRIRQQLSRVVGRAMINPRLDQDRMRAVKAQIERQVGRITVRPQLDQVSMRALRERINNSVGRIQVRARLDQESMMALRERLRNSTGYISVRLRLDRDSLTELRARIRAMVFRASLELDTDSDILALMSRRLADIESSFNRSSRAANNFGNQSSGAFSRAHGAARVFIALMPALLPMLGALVQGAVGLGGALIATFVGAAATLGAFAVVAIPTFNKITDAAKLSREEIANLPEGIRQAAGALKTLQEQYQLLVQRTEANVGLALAEGFNAAAAAVRTLDPLINSMSTVIGNIGREATEYFGGAHWQSFVDFMSKEMIPVWMSFWDIVKFLTQALMNLSVAFMPMAQWLLAAIADGMERFAMWAGTLANDPAFIQWVENAKESLRAFWDFLVSVTKFLFNLASALAPIGVVVMDMLSGIFNALSKMPPEWLAGIAGGLSAVMAALLFGATGPVALVAGVITGIAFALAYLYDSNEKVRNSINGFIDEMQTRFAPLMEFVRSTIQTKVIPAWDNLVAQFRTHVMPVLQELWQKFKDNVLPALEDLVRTIVDKVIPAVFDFLAAIQPFVAFVLKAFGDDAIYAIQLFVQTIDGGLQMVSGLLNTFTGLFTGDWELFWDGLEGIAEGFWTAIAGLFGLSLDELKVKFAEWDKAIKDGWNTFWADVERGWTDFWATIGGFFETEGQKIQDGWNTFWSETKTNFDTFVTDVQESWHGFWVGLLDGLGLNGEQIVNGWKEKWDQMWVDVSRVWEDIKAGWTAFWIFVGSLLETEKQKVIDSWNTFWDGISQKATEIWDTIKQGWTDFWTSGIGSTLTAETDKFDSQWNTFWDGVSQKASDIWTDIKNGWNTFWSDFQSTQDSGEATSAQSWGEWFQGLGESIGSWIRTEIDNWNNFWTTLNNTVTEWGGRIQSAWDGMLNGLREAGDRIWGDIQRAFDNGINGVKGAINGMIDTINGVFNFFQIPPIPKLAAGGTLALDVIPGFAKGANLWDEVGSGFKTNGPRAIVGEGNPNYPEYVIPTDPQYRGRATNLFRSLGSDIGMYADGGILGGMASAVGLPSLESVISTMGGVAAGPMLGIATGTATKVWDAVLKKIQDAMMTFGGLLGNGTGGGGVGWMMGVLRSAFPGLALISGLRPGAITATGNPSYHGKGRAVDVPPRMDVFNWIKANFGANTKELIFSPAGGNQVWNGRPHMYTGVTRANHWDHVHWAFDNGGLLPPGASMAFNGTGKPEAVLTNEQWDALAGQPTITVENSAPQNESMEKLNRTMESVRDLLEENGAGATIIQSGVDSSPQENAQAVRLALRLR